MLVQAPQLQNTPDAGARLKYCSGISMTVAKENHVNFSADSRRPRIQGRRGGKCWAKQGGHHAQASSSVVLTYALSECHFLQFLQKKMHV